MKIKKIRGQRRRWKDINNWVESHKVLDLDYLESSHREYAKINVHPWSGISMLNSEFLVVSGETRKRMIKGLFEIYKSWKLELDKLDEPYYLKIWLYNPHFSKSQVVCAIGNFLNFYESTFHLPGNKKEMTSNDFGSLRQEASQFKWEYALNEEHLDNSVLGSQEDYETLEEFEEKKKLLEDKLKKPHRTIKTEEDFGAATEFYSFYKGDVWLGEIND